MVRLPRLPDPSSRSPGGAVRRPRPGGDRYVRVEKPRHVGYVSGHGTANRTAPRRPAATADRQRAAGRAGTPRRAREHARHELRALQGAARLVDLRRVHPRGPAGPARPVRARQPLRGAGARAGGRLPARAVAQPGASPRAGRVPGARRAPAAARQQAAGRRRPPAGAGPQRLPGRRRRDRAAPGHRPARPGPHHRRQAGRARAVRGPARGGGAGVALRHRRADPAAGVRRLHRGHRRPAARTHRARPGGLRRRRLDPAAPQRRGRPPAGRRGAVPDAGVAAGDDAGAQPRRGHGHGRARGHHADRRRWLPRQVHAAAGAGVRHLRPRAR